MSKALPLVYVTMPVPPKGLTRLKQFCRVVVNESGKHLKREEFLKAIPGVDGLLVISTDFINKETIDCAGPQLKVVGTLSVGLDHVDLAECKRRGVKVGYTPNVLTDAVAEMTVGLTLTVSRRISEGIDAVRVGTWGKKWDNFLWLAGHAISKSVVGIIGLGRIGLATAKRFKAFEPSQIIYSGNSPKPEGELIGAKFCSFNDLLQQSDFVIATCALTEDTKNLMNAEAFKKMKSNAIFVNVTRGALVDQHALYDALSTKQIAGAAIDVTTPEPLPNDHKLLGLPNCVITPHLGSAEVGTRDGMMDMTVDNILAAFNGDPLPTPAYT